MKTYFYYIAMAILSLGFASCSDELFPEEQHPTDVEKKLVTLTVQAGTPTRLGIQENEDAISFTWEEGDVLHVVSGKDSYTDFVLTEGAGTAKGTFTAEANYNEGQQLQIIYSNNPDNPFQLDKDGNVRIDLSGQTGQLDERYQYLYGTASYSSQEPLTAHMEHLVSVIKLELSLPQEFSGNVQQLHFEDSHMNYRSDATLLLNEMNPFNAGDLVRNDELSTPDDHVITLNNLITNDKHQITTYLYVMNVDNYYKDTENNTNNYFHFGPMEIKITTTDENGILYYTAPKIKQEKIGRGDFYSYKTEAFKLMNFSNEDEATGTIDHPYEISSTDQFYSLMLRTSYNLSNRNGTAYSNCSYVLTSDIMLDNRYNWTPIGLGTCTFDGQGHSILGHQDINHNDQSGLFGGVGECTFKNLTLNANLNFGTNPRNDVGGLIGEVYNSTIENCHNMADLTANSYHFGGLVGYASETTFIGCTNTGNLCYRTGNSYYEELRMGGIIGEATGCIINACYNQSQFTIETYHQNQRYIGGLVGLEQDWLGISSQINGCWSLSTLSNTNQESVNYYGALLGQASNTVLQNCFYNESSQTGPVCTGSWNENLVDSFSGTTPTATQIASMNAAISDTGYKFTEDGTLRKQQGIGVPNINIKDWEW